MNKLHLKAHLALLGANLIYGANYSLAKEVVPQYIGPSGMILIRVTGAVLLFGLLWMLKPEWPKREDTTRFLLCAATGVAVNQLMFFEGLSLTTPIQASIILTANPILVLLAAALIAREAITLRKTIGIVLGLLGALVLLVNRDATAEGTNVPLGNFFILVNALSYSLYLVLVRKLMAKYRVITVMTWVFLPGLLMVAPFGIEQFNAVQWNRMPEYIMYLVAFVVIGTTFLAYLLNAYALVSVSASVVSAYVYSQPFIASLIALSLGKDSLHSSFIIAALLVFSGVYMVSAAPVKSQEKSQN
ncbi:MAG: DMT family transporter [Bacteroidia bacterium]